MTIETVKCDGPGCDNIRKETNHWFKVERGEALVIRPHAMPTTNGTDREILDLCGESCVIKVISSWLSDRRAGRDTEGPII